MPVAIDFLAEILLTDTEETPKVKSEGRMSTANIERSIAHRLLGTIWGANPLRVVIGRVALLERSYIASIRRLPLSSRLAFNLASPLKLLAMIATMPVFLAQIRVIQGHAYNENRLSFLSGMMVLGLMSLTFGAAYPRWFFKRHAKSHLWNRLCKELGVQDEVLHKVVGTSLFPWARKQKFDYFLSDFDIEMTSLHKRRGSE